MIEFVPNDLGLKVLSQNGEYRDFLGVALMGNEPIWRIEFSNKKHLECSAAHRVFGYDADIAARDLKVGDRVMTKSGRTTKVKNVFDTGRIAPVYDLIEVQGGHAYATNSIISKNCDFVSDDETLINPLTLSYMHGIKPSYYVKESRWYEDPQPNCMYLVGLDPGMGTLNDAAAIQIYRLPGMVQVGEWQSNAVAPREQMGVLLQLLWFLDDELRAHPDQRGDPAIFWTVENNSLGEANLQFIDDHGEHKFPGTLVNERRRKGTSKRFRKGLNTNPHSKKSVCAQFKNLIEGARMVVNSENLVVEMKNFVRGGGSYKAKPGLNDDLVCASLLCVRMLQSIRAQGIDVGEDLSSAFSDDEIFGEPMPIVV